MGKPIMMQKQTLIEPSSGWFNLRIHLLWRYRELVYFLAWRDIKIRYKQTILGITWVILQPVISMLVFSGLFGILLQVPTGGIPYPLFVLSGLLPWLYFSAALTKSSNSLVDNTSLITKIYFPRMVIPIAAMLSSLVDFIISMAILVIIMLSYGVFPIETILLLPIFLILAMITALGFGLWLSALNVRYRDVKHLLPFIIQIWMYLTPVVYGASLIPERYRWLLGLNPMTGVVDGFRWALFGNRFGSVLTSDSLLYILSVGIAFLILISGTIYFRYTEKNFADII